MLASEYREFVEQLEALFAGAGQHCTEAHHRGFWKAVGSKLSLVEFTRCVEKLLEREELPRRLSAALIWEARRELRVVPQSKPEPAEPKWEGDAWESHANLLLLRHITRRLQRDPNHYGRPLPYSPALRRVDGNPDPVMAEAMRCLLERKRAWALDMREMAAAHGQVSAEYQREMWQDFMAEAERDIAELRAKRGKEAA